ncbi:MAG: ORF6N domain-containing protein [Candidatus Binataceae bacterium]
MADSQGAIPLERIASRIYLIRGEKVMLDSDLARLYGVSTTRFNQQFKRNLDRFPDDFAFQLTGPEFKSLMSQIATSNVGRGGRRKLPWVFTEHGVAMLSSVLRSKRAIQVNVAIIRAFIKLRQILASNRELARAVERHDRQIAVLFDTVRKLMAPPEPPKKNPIGYIHHED